MHYFFLAAFFLSSFLSSAAFFFFFLPITIFTIRSFGSPNGLSCVPSLSSPIICRIRSLRDRTLRERARRPLRFKLLSIDTTQLQISSVVPAINQSMYASAARSSSLKSNRHLVVSQPLHSLLHPRPTRPVARLFTLHTHSESSLSFTLKETPLVDYRTSSSAPAIVLPLKQSYLLYHQSKE